MGEEVRSLRPSNARTDEQSHLAEISHISCQRQWTSYLLAASKIVNNTSGGVGGECGSWTESKELSGCRWIRDIRRVMVQALSAQSGTTKLILVILLSSPGMGIDTYTVSPA